jgi:hypothetical protein
MNEDKLTTIIAADYMYLIFIGNDFIIDKIINKLNTSQSQIEPINNKKKKINNYTKKNIDIYIKCEISNPCINMLEDDKIQNILSEDTKNSNNVNNNNIDNVNKKYILMDEGVESAQCLTYADITSGDMVILKGKHNSSKILTMMMVLNKYDTYYKLSYPILQLDEEENPDKLISKWLKDHNIENIVKELTIRPVNIVGSEHDILVFIALVKE